MFHDVPRQAGYRNRWEITGTGTHTVNTALGCAGSGRDREQKLSGLAQEHE